jgi:hypothetical protein
MKPSAALLLCLLALSSCAGSLRPAGRGDPPGAVVSVVSGAVLLKVEVSSPADKVSLDVEVDGKRTTLDNGEEGKESVLSFRDEKRLEAGDRYALDLKPGERAVLSFDSAEAVRTILEIRKHGQVTRFVLEHDDLIGKMITISDD